MGKLDITSDDLNIWAAQIGAAHVLPKLIRRLLLETTPVLHQIDMPADNGVRLKGWDGIVSAEFQTTFCPAGWSFWELTVEKNIKSKLNVQFQQRTQETQENRRLHATYVAVTARRFLKKHEWIEEKKRQGSWADVKLYDAENLAAWLERAPAAAAWFAETELGRPIHGITDAETFLESWSKRTPTPLPWEIVLIGREDISRQLLDWLDRKGQWESIYLSGEQREEVVLFVAATVARSKAHESWLSRTVIVKSQAAWQWLMANNQTEMLLLPVFEGFDAGEAGAYRGAVLVPLGHGARSGISRLRPIPRRALAEALIKHQTMERHRAWNLAERSDGNLAVLQRLCGYVEQPAWVGQVPPSECMAMLLVGAWNPENPHDREVIRKLNAEPDKLEYICAQLASRDAPPIRHDTPIWRWISRDDVWPYLAHQVFANQGLMKRFEDVILSVLGGLDSRHDESLDAGLMALRDEFLGPSFVLCEGLAGSLQKLGDPHGSEENAGTRQQAQGIIKRLLEPTWHRWVAIGKLLRYLAAAAPGTFLDAAQRCLAHDEEMARASDVGGFYQALADLAWRQEHFASVVHLLAGLADKAGPEAKDCRATELLFGVLHPWHPQSRSAVTSRIDLIRGMFQRKPAVGWRLGLEFLNKFDSLLFTSDPGGLTAPLPPGLGGNSISEDTRKQMEAVLDALAEHSGKDGARWADVLDSTLTLVARSEELASTLIHRLLDALDKVCASILDPDGRLWITLRKCKNWLGRRDDDLPEVIERLGRFIDMMEPRDPAVRAAGLFESDYRYSPAVEAQRHERLREIVDELAPYPDRWNLLMRMAALLAGRGTEGVLGNILATVSFASELDDSMRKAVGGPPMDTVALYFLSKRARSEGAVWIEQILRQLVAEERQEAAASLALSLDQNSALWDMLDRLGSDVAQAYWRQLSDVRGEHSSEAWERAIARMLDAQNIAGAIASAACAGKHIAVGTVIRVLEAWAHPDSQNHLRVDQRDWLEQLFRRLDEEEAEGIDEDLSRRFELAGFIYLKREPRRLYSALASEIKLFTSLVCWIYQREGDGGTTDLEDGGDDEGMHHRRRGARDLLQAWHGLPGGELPAKEREDRLFDWAKQALDMTRDQGRVAGGMIEVARVLARAPAAPDGKWPCLAVRRLLDEAGAHDLEQRLAVAKIDLDDGRMWRSSEGGARERERAEALRRDANAVSSAWPRTAQLLSRLADDYAALADHLDQESRRMGVAPAQAGAIRSAENRELGKSTPASAEVTPLPISPPRISRVEELYLHAVGPAPSIDICFAPRLNVLTGDNGAGKTFVLDVIWWALTGRWPVHPAWVQQGAEGPTIRINKGANSTYDAANQQWSRPSQWPVMDGLVIYARVDGGFSVWDSIRAAARSAVVDLGGGLHLSRDELWDGHHVDGKKGEKITLCKGLIEDWIDWQARHPALFEQFCQALKTLSHDDELMEPGGTTRLSVSNVQDVPLLRFPYGSVPIVHVSAGVKRVLGLAYMLVWTWSEHNQAAVLSNRKPAENLVVLIDEVEAHLHPRWQRVLLPALISVSKSLADSMHVQIMASTHAPLVTASVEPLFEPDRDELFRFALRDNKVQIERLPWRLRGDASVWLTDVFGLREPRSREAEEVLGRAMAAMRRSPPDLDELNKLNHELRLVFKDTDPFWSRWAAQIERLQKPA